MHHPIAYTYDADIHCEGCAYDRFGTDNRGEINGIDSEGNEVGALAPWDEWWDTALDEPQSLVCGTCLGVIEELP